MSLHGAAEEEYEVSTRDHLASLMGAEVSALVMVAREGIEPLAFTAGGEHG
jgi:hypothetical protein